MRAVPLNNLLVQRLQQDLKRTPRGHKLYVPDDQETHEAIKALQTFIWLYCPSVQDKDSTRPMTFHGLRHTYAAEKYQVFIHAG